MQPDACNVAKVELDSASATVARNVSPCVHTLNCIK